MPTRRRFLKHAGQASLLLPSIMAIEPGVLETVLGNIERPLPDDSSTLLGLVRFEDEKRSGRRERTTGRGLTGRFRQDLSRIGPDTLITPNDRFYVRTGAPEGIRVGMPWSITMTPGSHEPTTIDINDIVSRAIDIGVHLMECSGNGLGGLISAAEWCGVRLVGLLEERGFGDDERILVSGLDRHPGSRGWKEGQVASWVFTREQLAASGAFLATHMNGERIDPDHGYPVRLVIPGWYGCSCIKWVNEIRAVDDDERATGQMREFASRTHQRGTPRRARDYRAAVIDICAQPVRVERRRRRDGSEFLRIVGILWGGSSTLDELQIRLGRDSDFQPVQNLNHGTHRTWTLWSHDWSPAGAGRYTIDLRVDDEEVLTRKLSRGDYRRVIDTSG